MLHISNHTSFAIDDTVSVFETNIRVLGGLLSAHGLLTEGFDDTGFDPSVWCPWYDGALLRHAQDLADRLLPAFNTPTQIPYGAVNLMRGVVEGESTVASTAGAGSLLLEFGTLSRLVRDPKYYHAAFRAMHALHARAASTGLVGNHIDITSGEWVALEAGVGGLVDSFYEYMYKGYVLFGDERLLRMFSSSYKAIRTYLHKRPWYLNADMTSGHTSSLAHSSLAAFWPGLQVLFGDVDDAVETARAHYSVWRRYGCLPEGYDVAYEAPMAGQINYPLRPELVESVFYLHWATNDSSWVGVARAMMFSLEKLTKVRCGFAAIKDTASHEIEDLMPSFVMSETLKYLYLVFASEGEDGRPHWVRSGRYVFTTEAHPLRIAIGDMRDILGPSFDTKEEVEEDVKGQWKRGRSTGDEGQAMTGGKCKRRRGLEEKLPCGYSMAGTDFPKLHAVSLGDPRMSLTITPMIAKSMTQQIRERASQHGGRGVLVGEVLFGEGWACRIVKIDGNMVSFARLDMMEAELERARWGRAEGLRRAGRGNKCRRVSAVDVVVRNRGRTCFS